MGAVACFFCFRAFAEQDSPSPDAILRMEETSERTSVTFIWTLELAADWLVVVACEPLIWALRCYRRMHGATEVTRSRTPEDPARPSAAPLD